jgi:hypothetical protein
MYIEPTKPDGLTAAGFFLDRYFWLTWHFQYVRPQKGCKSPLEAWAYFIEGVKMEEPVLEVKTQHAHWFSPVAHFAAHAAVGSMVFIIIAMPAFGLGLLVSWLKIQGTASYVIGVLTFLEYAIVTIDAAAFLGYLVYSSYTTFKERIK